MTEAESEAFEEIVGEIHDLADDRKVLIEALDCAESCETLRDLLANLRDAESAATALIDQIRELRDRALAATKKGP